MINNLSIRIAPGILGFEGGRQIGKSNILG